MLLIKELQKSISKGFEKNLVPRMIQLMEPHVFDRAPIIQFCFRPPKQMLSLSFQWSSQFKDSDNVLAPDVAEFFSSSAISQA